MSEDGDVRELRVRFDLLAETVRQFISRVEPVLSARSGDEARLRQIEASLDHSHDKHRQHFEAIQRLEREARASREELKSEILERLDRIDERDRLRDRREVRLMGYFAGVGGVLAIIGGVVVPLLVGWLKGQLGIP